MGKPENDVALKARYEKAVKMLYGDEQGYIEKKNIKLFQQLERLHKQWQDAMEEQAAFWKKCIEEKKEEIRKVKTKKEDIKHKSRDSEGRKDKEEYEKEDVEMVKSKATSGTQYFQAHAGPYVERTKQAFTEFDNLRAQIEQIRSNNILK